MILAVDCGVWTCGAALLLPPSGLVYAAAAVTRDRKGPETGAPAWDAMADAVADWVDDVYSGRGPDVVVLEAQQSYSPGQQKGRQSDILELMGVAGAMRFGDARRVSYLPREWKGQMPGDDFIRERIRPRLTAADEARIVGAAGVKHNAYDAVGLGLFYLGRLKPHRVFPGAT